VPWSELGRTPPRAKPSNARATLSPNAPGTLESLKEFLQRSTGKTISVRIEEDGRENRFRFTVPPGGLK
jgi:hypothetical protein